ncbi:MAG TPA: hypothetical protein VFZ36_07695 [Vicinamibacterales bacterium]
MKSKTRAAISAGNSPSAAAIALERDDELRTRPLDDFVGGTDLDCGFLAPDYYRRHRDLLPGDLRDHRGDRTIRRVPDDEFDAVPTVRAYGPRDEFPAADHPASNQIFSGHP